MTHISQILKTNDKKEILEAAREKNYVQKHNYMNDSRFVRNNESKKTIEQHL